MSILKILMTFSMIGMLITPLGAHAQTSAPNLDEVRELAYAHDFQTLETLLDQLQEDVLAERLTYTDQRNVYEVLSVLQLDLIKSVNLWHDQMPRSIHAQTLQAQMLFSLGWRMRGEEAVKLTYPEAMDGMRRLHAEGMRIAKAVFNKHPNFVPAADAVMWMDLTVSSQPGFWELLSGDTPFEKIMRLTPNHRTLMERLTSTRPQWGGNFGQVIEICDTYALMVKDVEGFTSEICKIEAIYTYDFRAKELLKWAQEALDQTDHPILERARWVDAVRDRPTRAGAQALRTKGIAELEYRDIRLASKFDGFRQGGANVLNITALIFDAKRKQALQELEHDPYNPKLLNVLMMDENAGVSPKVEPSLTTMVEYSRRKLMFAPYNHRYWGHFAQALNKYRSKSENFAEGALAEVEGSYRNAVVYSNYSANALSDYLYHFYMQVLGEMQINSSTRLGAAGKYRDPAGFTPQELAQQNKQMICPLIVTERMLRAVCDKDPGSFNCMGAFVGKEDVERIFEIATEREACAKELTAPLQDLLYFPIEFDWQNPSLQ